MKIEITHRWSGAVLFSIEAGSLKLAVEAAVKSGADLASADLASANLSGANLMRAYLADARLTDVDLTHANLTGANLAGADLTRADLTRADLANADLTSANFTSANFTNTDLTNTDLTNADLTDVDFTDVDFTDVDFTGVNLADVNRAGAPILGGFPDDWRAHAWKKDGEVQVQVGCNAFTLSAARDYWRGRDNRREVMAFLDYVEAVARLRSWLPTPRSPRRKKKAAR